MSGPKGGSYRVETAAQRETRMLRDARADYARAQAEWENAVVRIEAARQLSGAQLSCSRPQSPATEADSAAYTRAAAELRSAAETAVRRAGAAREAAAARVHAAQVARLVNRIGLEPGSDFADSGKSARQSRWQSGQEQRAEPDRNTIDRSSVAVRVQRRLEELAGLDHNRDRVDVLIADIAAAGTESRVDMLIRELDLLIDDARAATATAEKAAIAAAELAAMQSRLDALPAAPVAAVRERISALITAGATEIPADLPGLVDEAVRAADAEDDRGHVAAVMSSALQHLGYRTGPEFSTDLSGARGTAYARSSGSHYGIKLRLEPASGRFTAQAVKSDATLTSAQEDTAAEDEFCSVLGEVVELARRGGVELDLDVRTPAGAHQIQQVADTVLGAATRSTSQTSGARREMRRI